MNKKKKSRKKSYEGSKETEEEKFKDIIDYTNNNM